MKNIFYNYFTVQGWMVQALGLSKTDLLVFAIIYGFHNSGIGFSASREYISSFVGCSDRSVTASLSSLESQGLVRRIPREGSTSLFEVDISFVREKCNDYILANRISVESDFPDFGRGDTLEKISTLHGKNFHPTLEKISTDNIYNNISNDIDNNASVKKHPSQKRMPSSIKEVDDYCREKNYPVDAVAFWNNYEKSDDNTVWKDRYGSVVKDWKAKLRVVWASRNKDKGYDDVYHTPFESEVKPVSADVSVPVGSEGGRIAVMTPDEIMSAVKARNLPSDRKLWFIRSVADFRQMNLEEARKTIVNGTSPDRESVLLPRTLGCRPVVSMSYEPDAEQINRFGLTDPEKMSSCDIKLVSGSGKTGKVTPEVMASYILGRKPFAGEISACAEAIDKGMTMAHAMMFRKDFDVSETRLSFSLLRTRISEYPIISVLSSDFNMNSLDDIKEIFHPISQRTGSFDESISEIEKFVDDFLKKH